MILPSSSLRSTDHEGAGSGSRDAGCRVQDIVIAGNRFSELQNRTLSLEELCMHPLVSMESGTTTRLFWDNLFEEQGLDLHRASKFLPTI